MDQIGLSEDQVHNILSDLVSPEGLEILSWQLAVKFGKNGQEMKEYEDLIEAKKALVEQNVLAKDAIQLMTDLTEFFQMTGLDPVVFVSSFRVYSKFASKMTIRTCEDLEKKLSSAHRGLKDVREELNALRMKYETLTGHSVPQDDQRFGADLLFGKI